MNGVESEPGEVERIDHEILRIERSIRCFKLALAGCIPVLGLPWAYGSLREFKRVKRSTPDGWNAAARHLLAGRIVGGIAFVFNAILWALLFVLLAVEFPLGLV